MVDAKVPKKVLQAEKLFQENQERARVYKNIERVTRQPLPPHKERFFNIVSTQAYVQFYNAEQKFKDAYRKLSDAHKRMLADRTREKHGQA